MLKCFDRHMDDIFLHFILLRSYSEVNIEVNLQFL